jgi:hypothetical protein
MSVKAQAELWTVKDVERASEIAEQTELIDHACSDPDESPDEPDQPQGEPQGELDPNEPPDDPGEPPLTSVDTEAELWTRADVQGAPEIARKTGVIDQACSGDTIGDPCECDLCQDPGTIRTLNAPPCPNCGVFFITVGHICPECRADNSDDSDGLGTERSYSSHESGHYDFDDVGIRRLRREHEARTRCFPDLLPGSDNPDEPAVGSRGRKR